MKIRRKLFNYSEGSDKTNIPYFIDGVTESGRRYKVLVTPEGRGKRQYLDPYRRRSSEEVYEEYYSERDDSYPDDWSEEDKQ